MIHRWWRQRCSAATHYTFFSDVTRIYNRQYTSPAEGGEKAGRKESKKDDTKEFQERESVNEEDKGGRWCRVEKANKRWKVKAMSERRKRGVMVRRQYCREEKVVLEG